MGEKQAKFSAKPIYPNLINGADKETARLAAQLVGESLGFLSAKHLKPVRPNVAALSATERKLDVTLRFPAEGRAYGGHFLIHIAMRRATTEETEIGHRLWIPTQADVDLSMPSLNPLYSSLPVLESSGKIAFTFGFLRDKPKNVFPYEAVRVDKGLSS